MNIIFLGAPGSGKGTQASLISKALNIPAISTGDSLRKEMDRNTEVGIQARKYIESGALVPDEIVNKIAIDRIFEADCEKGFILDGFPRSLSQANILESKKQIDLVIYFNVDDEVLEKRISGRYSCAKCGQIYNKFFTSPLRQGVCDVCGSLKFKSREDDNESTVKKRLEVYHKQTAPLIDHYKKNNLLVSISSIESAPLVFEALIKTIKSFSN
jgi:adenylate kinase